MGGFLGIGGSSSKTDRGNQLAATQAGWNIFEQGLGLANQLTPQGFQQQQVGQNNLNDAAGYWQNILTAGRTQTAQNAAPAVNAQLAGADATRAQRAQFGSGRSGGTVAADANAGTTTQKNIDDIINENLVGGRKEAAEGLSKIGAVDLSAGATSIGQALSGLGLSSQASEAIMQNATGSGEFNVQQQEQLGSSLGTAAAQIALAFL